MSEERKIYQNHGIRISKSDIGWVVHDMARAGKDAKNAGEEVERNVSFHPNLASACEEAALRITDLAESTNLKQYSRELRSAIAELRIAIIVAHPGTVAAPETGRSAVGSALAVGARDRSFESSHPDQSLLPAADQHPRITENTRLTERPVRPAKNI